MIQLTRIILLDDYQNIIYIINTYIFKPIVEWNAAIYGHINQYLINICKNALRFNLKGSISLHHLMINSYQNHCY